MADTTETLEKKVKELTEKQTTAGEKKEKAEEEIKRRVSGIQLVKQKLPKDAQESEGAKSVQKAIDEHQAAVNKLLEKLKPLKSEYDKVSKELETATKQLKYYKEKKAELQKKYYDGKNLEKDKSKDEYEKRKRRKSWRR